ncbi:neurochondrin isoform X2 [Sphaerodactylus townsendi]|uniref:neurochondrin isoform X2 n=1 Tax=Sphaerodactylus townsendi TaxID=933632 RepID=UPI002025E6A1|nr:neurochondrin isoform X2 [Sphaerodactylus townsendi]
MAEGGQLCLSAIEEQELHSHLKAQQKLPQLNTANAMATGADIIADDSESSRNATLERCLNVLRDARNDSEQFAALLLITKVAKAGEIDSKTRRRIFDAVGFTFPNRLLISKDPPEGVPGHTFQALGLTLLACFCTNPDLAEHPQVLNKIPTFNSVIAACDSGNASCGSMINDVYQCLGAILATPKGPRELVNRGALVALCQAYVNHSYGYDQALQLLVGLLTSAEAKCWLRAPSALMGVLDALSAEFQKAEDVTKFQLCEALRHFVPPLLLPGSECLQSLYQGLSSILSSKLSASQRDPALKLAACLTQAYGSGWIPTGRSGSKFFALLANLACVEVRMSLEYLDLAAIDEKQELVATCYVLMEHAILECTREEESLLQEEQKVQLVGILEEAFGAVVYYLSQAGWEKLTDPFVFASIRILGAWLAEETSSLKQEICDLLPFLLHYAKLQFEMGKKVRSSLQNPESGDGQEPAWQGDALRFLLPGLSHLTAEDQPRAILISEGAPLLLCNYFSHQWELFISDSEIPFASDAVESTLQTACAIFLNFVVAVPELISREDCFAVLMEELLKSLPSLRPQGEHLSLVAGMTALGLMMARKQTAHPGLQKTPEAEGFFSAAITFLAKAHVAQPDTVSESVVLQLSPAYEAAWPNIGELWLLGMQAFASCVPLFRWLPEIVLHSVWLQDLLGFLGCVSPTSVDLELVTAFQGVLVELATSSHPCREVIQQHRGAELANLYGMAALEQCLSHQ